MPSERVQRRLAAVVAADVVGYSRLIEQDEATTLAALKDRRRRVLNPLLASHHGRIVKLMGDGFLAEFGSAVNALECALALQKGMAAANENAAADRCIVLRIGINLGDVVVEGNDLYGDGINIAARLEQLAEPGGILVSGSVRDFVSNKVDISFENAGLQNSEEHHHAGTMLARLGNAKRPGRCQESHGGKAIDCRAALYKHVRRSRTGLLLRWHY